MSYTKNTWVTGDIVTAAKLNNIENGVYNNDQNISSEAIARAAADGKLQGSMAAAYSTSATYAVGDYCIYQGQLYRCTTAITTAEAWTSGHWSAVALGNDTRDLRSAIRYETSTSSAKYVSANSTVTGGTEMTTEGYVKPDGTYAGNNNYRCTSLLDISGISRGISAYCYETNAFLCFAFYDADRQFISGIGGNSESWTRISGAQTIPSTAKYVRVTMLVADTGGYATVSVTTATSISDTVDVIDAQVDGMEDMVSSMQNTVSTIADDFGYNTNIVTNIPIQSPSIGYMAQDGSTGAAASLAYTEKISCTEGDVFRFCNKYQGKSVSIRFVTAFSGNTAKSSQGASDVGSYTVPTGIDGVVITGYVATSGDATSLPYLYKWTKGQAPTLTNNSAFRLVGDLSGGESLSAPIVNVAKNRAATFTATIATFDAIVFGRSDYQNAIRVDNTNVELLDSFGQVSSTVAHGLTITNTISVRIYNTLIGGANILIVCVSSNGTDATPIELTWSAYLSGKPFVKSEGSTLTDCTFSYVPFDINKKIWAFGDSYLGFSSDRWMGILSSYGYADNLLVNAYAGESSAQNLPAFLSLISLGRPKFALWANGMNEGGDGTSTPSSAWRNSILAFITTCLSCNVIPVLATIPTVPSVKNENKNSWVRNSGYRYIDFAKAVGAQSDGTWYSGMLSSDYVHPTSKGAIALCGQALADFPELMETS